jgi:very-short-patch-repair endonuclease
MKRSETITAEARLMRQVPTIAEVALWHLVRNRAFSGLKFRRMQPVSGFIASLLCSEARMILDLRAETLLNANDIHRLAAFRANGWRVLSVTEAEALADPRRVLDQLLHEAT